MTYQAVSICRILANILPDIPVHHHFRNHRTLASLSIDIDGNELQEVGMGNIHPEDALFTKELVWVDHLLIHSKWLAGNDTNLLGIISTVFAVDSQGPDSHHLFT
jgi:hypothetical protein